MALAIQQIWKGSHKILASKVTLEKSSGRNLIQWCNFVMIQRYGNRKWSKSNQLHSKLVKQKNNARVTCTVVMAEASSGLLLWLRKTIGPSYPWISLRAPERGRLRDLLVLTDSDLRSEAWINLRPAWPRLARCFCSIKWRWCSSFCCRRCAEGMSILKLKSAWIERFDEKSTLQHNSMDCFSLFSLQGGLELIYSRTSQR